MVKFLLWGIAIWLAIKYVLPALRRINFVQPSQPPSEIGAQDTVRCAHCGVYVLRSEAVIDGTTYYCSDGHRQARRS